MKFNQIVKEARECLDEGYYNPELIFKILYPRHRCHYYTIRRAIHEAKCGVFR